jgi:hypothetical protein
MASPDPRQSEPLSGRKSTYPPVQILRATSIAGFNQDYLLFSGATTEVRSYIDTLERNHGEVH